MAGIKGFVLVQVITKQNHKVKSIIQVIQGHTHTLTGIIVREWPAIACSMPFNMKGMSPKLTFFLFTF